MGHIKTGIVLVEIISQIKYDKSWTWHKWTDKSRIGQANLKWWIRKYKLGRGKNESLCG